MTIEFAELKDFLSKGLYLKTGDYVYHHDREGYPLQKDLDASGLYVITTANGHKLEVVSFSSEEAKIDLETVTGYWWVLKLPEPIRQKMGLQ